MAQLSTLGKFMKTKIKSFPDLHKALIDDAEPNEIFRGVRSVDYKLQTKIGRIKKFRGGDLLEAERHMLRLLKDQAVPHLGYTPKNDWEWLAIAQHHSLPTRLLDWSRNPLVAAWFAVEREHDGDSLIYCYENGTYIDLAKNPDPFARAVVGKFVPPHITKRITAQAGLFTIHPEPAEIFAPKSVRVVRIASEFRKPLKKILWKYGIHRATLFPDIDGLCKHLEWLRTECH